MFFSSLYLFILFALKVPYVIQPAKLDKFLIIAKYFDVIFSENAQKDLLINGLNL